MDRENGERAYARGKVLALSSDRDLGFEGKLSRSPTFPADVAETWGGLQPVYVHPSPNHVKTFAWDADYSRLSVSTAYRNLVLKRLQYATDTLRGEFNGYTLHECRNDKCEVRTIYLPMIDTGSFHPYRSFKHSDRALGQALNILDWIHYNTPASFTQFICLTAPGWVSKDLMDHDTIGRFERAVSDFLKRLHSVLFPNKKSKLGGLFVIHPWRSKHPLEKHLHAHLILPCVAFNSNDPQPTVYDNVDRRFHRFKPFINEDTAKRCWRGALIRVGLWDPMDPSLPDVHLDYVHLSPLSNDRPRLVHHLRYVFRLPLTDLNKYLEQADIERLDLDERFTRFLLHYTTRRHRLGWLCNLKRFGFVSHKSSKPRCPICGQEMVKIGTIRSNLPRVAHYFRERSGEWCRIPPPFEPLPGQTDDINRSRQPRASPTMPERGRHPECDNTAQVGWSDFGAD